MWPKSVWNLCECEKLTWQLPLRALSPEVHNPHNHDDYDNADADEDDNDEDDDGDDDDTNGCGDDKVAISRRMGMMIMVME